MYQNYVFDLYGTLVDIRTDEEKEEVWKKLSLFYGYYGARYFPGELKAFYEKLVKDQIGNPGDMGGYAGKSYEGYPEIKIERVFSELFAQKGVRTSDELAVYTGQFFRILSTEYIRLYAGADEMLRKLRKEGKKLYLLSNAQRIFTEYEMAALRLTDCFNGILLSSDYGIKKPDKRFFEILLEKYGLQPEESVMIGNDEGCDIVGAKQVGLYTFYIHSNISPEYEGKAEATHLLMEPDFEKAYAILCGKKKNDRKGI